VSLAASGLATAPIVAAISALAIIALLAVWLLPRRRARRWAAQGIEGGELAELENNARSTLVQILGGVALILTFVATWLQIADTRDATDRTLQLTSSQQETERFTRAVEQLGSPRMEVRVGAIYGLQQTAHDSPQRRPAVAQLVLAFLRTRHPVREDDPRLRDVDARINELRHGATAGPCELTTVRPWPDTQAAFSVILGLPRSVRGPLDLAGVDLIGVRARGADLAGADLQSTELAGSDLAGANFDHAQVYGPNLRLACVRKARFDGAYVYFPGEAMAADFTGSDFSNACGSPSLSLRATTHANTRLPAHELNVLECRQP